MKSDEEKVTTKSLVRQLKENPEMLTARPELFQTAVIDFLASLETRLNEIEELYLTPLQKK